MEEKKEETLILDHVIDELRKNHLKEKEEMFVQEGTVRPGIIVLVNDTDWELLDQGQYQIQENDTVTFISTLHGGWIYCLNLNLILISVYSYFCVFQILVIFFNYLLKFCFLNFLKKFIHFCEI